MCVTTAAVLAVGSTLAAQSAGAAEDRTTALDRAAELATRHRYQEVVDVLEPALGCPEGALEASQVAFELGRAYFHLGRYDRAYAAFKRVEDPDHFEDGAILPYLEASAYLLERKDEALEILKRLLASGRTDLELAVTLPGERAFLQDADVWRLLDRFARRLDVSLVTGSVMGVSLGDPRPQAEPVLKEIPTRLDGGDGAGPRTVFEPSWDEENRLAGFRLGAEELLRYTPYRLTLDHGLGWASSPDEVVEQYGAPTSFVPEGDGGVLMTWVLPAGTTTLGFGPPRTPRPEPIAEGRAMLRLVELRPTLPHAGE